MLSYEDRAAAGGCRVVALGGTGLSAGFCLLGIPMTDPQAVVSCFAPARGAPGLCEGIFRTTALALEPRNGGLACAVLNTGGNGIGLLAPIVTPLLGLRHGFDAAVVVACVVCTVGACSGWASGRWRRSESRTLNDPSGRRGDLHFGQRSGSIVPACTATRSFRTAAGGPSAFPRTTRVPPILRQHQGVLCPPQLSPTRSPSSVP